MSPPPPRTGFRDLSWPAKVFFVISVAAVCLGLIAIAAAVVAAVLIVLGMLGHGVVSVWS